MTVTNESLLGQINCAIAEYSKCKSQSAADRDVHFSTFITASLAAIDRITGKDSTYAEQARSAIDAYRNFHGIEVANRILGVVYALRDDVESGFTASLRELLHAEVFADFLDMANYLVSEGYKDAAAVMGGGVLESHLRQLCMRANIETEIVTDTDVKPKKADRLNSDLAKAEVYGKLDQKNITAWLDLRNKAAHAKYDEYTKEQVLIFLSSLSDFILRNPA